MGEVIMVIILITNHIIRIIIKINRTIVPSPITLIPITPSIVIPQWERVGRRRTNLSWTSMGIRYWEELMLVS
jgi:hypothetical protein